MSGGPTDVLRLTRNCSFFPLRGSRPQTGPRSPQLLSPSPSGSALCSKASRRAVVGLAVKYSVGTGAGTDTSLDTGAGTDASLGTGAGTDASLGTGAGTARGADGVGSTDPKQGGGAAAVRLFRPVQTCSDPKRAIQTLRGGPRGRPPCSTMPSRRSPWWAL